MLGVYIHWPFCLAKCTYCSFVSTADQSAAVRYSEALQREVLLTGAHLKQKTDTIFFGGGTPSLCPENTLAGILDNLRAFFGVTDDAEISVEMNPKTASDHWLNAAFEAGVNRISLGLQSTQMHHLKMLGRLHSVADFQEAYCAARKAGFANLNVDLIYGLPSQTLLEWQDTLQYVLDLEPEHISLYALSIEKGTPLQQRIASGCVGVTDEDLAADMYLAARQILSANGFVHYEISNFARPGYECRHNLKYWTLEEYQGLGVAAHSLIGCRRFSNTASLDDYVNAVLSVGTALETSTFIDPREREKEFFMLRTRLDRGFSEDDFVRTFGRPLGAENRTGLHTAMKQGLLCLAGERYVPTEKGFLFQNQLALLLMSDV